MNRSNSPVHAPGSAVRSRRSERSRALASTPRAEIDWAGLRDPSLWLFHAPAGVLGLAPTAAPAVAAPILDQP